MTEIHARAPVAGDEASLVDPASFLPAPARPAGPGRWAVDFAVGPFHHEAVVALGPVWRTEGREGRGISWRSQHDAHDALPYESLFPSVEGVLVLEDGHVSVHVHYTPGAGLLGRAVDPLLRPVARSSVTQFVADVAGRLAPTTATSGGGQ
jgi:hypothetical protein